MDTQNSLKQNKSTHYLALLLVVIPVGVLLILPSLFSFFISFQDYSLMYGLFGGMWIGIENYSRLFSSYEFLSVLFNSLRISFVGNVLPTVLGVILGGFFVTRSDKIHPLSLGILLSPTFIPTSIYASLLSLLFGFELLTNQIGFDFAVFFVGGIPKLFFSAFFVVCLGMLSYFSEKKHVIFLGGAILLIYAFANLLSPDTQVVSMLSSPLTNEYSMTMDNYQFTVGLMNLEMSYATTVWMVKTILQIILLCVGAVILNRFLKADGSQTERSESAMGNHSIVISAIAGIIAIAIPIALFTFYAAQSNEGFSSMEALGTPFLNSLLILLISTPLFIIFSTVAAYGLSGFSPIVSTIFCSALAILSINLIGQYVSIANFGLVNTFLPTAFYEHIKPEYLLCLSVLWIFARKSNTETGIEKKTAYFLPYLIIYTGLFMAMLWGSYQFELYYTVDASLFSVALSLRSILLGGYGMGSLAFLAATALPAMLFGAASIALFALFYKQNEIHDMKI